MFKVEFRYKGEPDPRLYGLKSSILKRELATIDKMAHISEDVAQQIVANARSNWSAKSPAGANKPPAVDTGNLDSSSTIYNRDLSGRFQSANSKMFTIIWDTTRGNAPGGRPEYAAVQEYGLDSLKTPHPFLQPAMDEIRSQAGRRYRDGL